MPEMDDFERRSKTLVLKENTMAKIVQNIFAYSFVSEHSKQFFFILRKNTCIFSGGGSTPPPLHLVDTSPKNASFL